MNLENNIEKDNYKFIEKFIKHYEFNNNTSITNLSEILIFKIMIFQRKYNHDYNIFITKVCELLNLDKKNYL